MFLAVFHCARTEIGELPVKILITPLNSATQKIVISQQNSATEHVARWLSDTDISQGNVGNAFQVRLDL